MCQQTKINFLLELCDRYTSHRCPRLTIHLLFHVLRVQTVNTKSQYLPPIHCAQTKHANTKFATFHQPQPKTMPNIISRSIMLINNLISICGYGVGGDGCGLVLVYQPYCININQMSISQTLFNSI